MPTVAKPSHSDARNESSRFRSGPAQPSYFFELFGHSLPGPLIAYFRWKSNQTFFDALDWLAQLATHIPTKGEQMVRYYGFYSNKSRGLRKKAGTDDAVPALIESEVSSKEIRKNWARLIQTIYNVNPLLCPNCSGSMRIIAFIEDEQLVKKILKHLGLWDVKRKPTPRANPPEADLKPLSSMMSPHRPARMIT